MQVEKVLEYFSSSNTTFDVNGRFIYAAKLLSDRSYLFIIYDIMFNEYIELTADNSFSNIQAPILDHGIYNFLPIDTKHQLFIVTANITTTIILLVHLNKEQKTYGVLDEVVISKCYEPHLLRDDDMFGLFFKNKRNGKMAILPFTVEANQIKLKAKKNFNYEPFSRLCEPRELYLHKNKLWFIRHTDIRFRAPRNPFYHRPPDPPEPRQDANLRISYFDLREDSPSEICVGEIELNHLENPDSITNLKWAQDSLFFQLRTSKFDVFDLIKHSWSPEAVDCGLALYDDEWIDFQPATYWNMLLYPTINIDEKFVLIAISQKSKTLHRISLKNPFQLRDIAWTAALNAGFFNRDLKICLPPNLPYARVL